MTATPARPRGGLAVMADRQLPADEGRDFFPTWPWATRALCTHVLPRFAAGSADPWRASVWEPAAGQGHMARPLGEFFERVIASDIHDYGVGYPQHDFLSLLPLPGEQPDWVITNPPFRLFAAFAERALSLARVGFALFGRLAVLESQQRYERLFRDCPPAVVAPFVERVPLAAGRLGETTATAYAWLIWWRRGGGVRHPTELCWIPPCRAQLTRRGDDAIGSAP